MRKVILELCAGALFLLKLVTYLDGGIDEEYNAFWPIVGFILAIQTLTLIIARKKDKDEFREVDPFMAMAMVIGIAALLLTIGMIVYVLSTWIARKQREKKEENSRDDRVISY